MLSKISFGKRSNRHSECVPQAIRIVILSRADGEGSLIARECISRLRVPLIVCAIRDDAAALGAISYTRGLRAKIFPPPDFQAK